MIRVYLNLGWVALHDGDRRRAEALFRESLDIFHEIDDKFGTVFTLQGLAAATGIGEQTEKAVRIFSAAEAYFKNYAGLQRTPADQREYERKDELDDDTESSRRVTGSGSRRLPAKIQCPQ